MFPRIIRRGVYPSNTILTSVFQQQQRRCQRHVPFNPSSRQRFIVELKCICIWLHWRENSGASRRLERCWINWNGDKEVEGFRRAWLATSVNRDGRLSWKIVSGIIRRSDSGALWKRRQSITRLSIRVREAGDLLPVESGVKYPHLSLSRSWQTHSCYSRTAGHAPSRGRDYRSNRLIDPRSLRSRCAAYIYTAN